jgi:signal peptidase II
MSKKNIRFLIYCLFAAAIVAVDQWTKYLVVENIPLFSYVGAIPKLFHLTYVQNTGAAFSALEGMQWLFVLVFAALTAAVLYEYFAKPMAFTTFER